MTRINLVQKKILAGIVIITLLSVNAWAENNLTIHDNINHLTVQVKGAKFNNYDFISFEDIAKILGLEYKWNPITDRVEIVKEPNEIVFVKGKNTVLVNNRIIQMTPSLQLIGTRLFIPVEFVEAQFGNIFNCKITWNKQTNTLSIDSVTPLTSLREKERQNIVFAKGLEEPMVRTYPYLHKGEPNSSSFAEGKIMETGTIPESLRIRFVVIDPGHGGKDPGAIGKNGLKEKDVNLYISKKIKELLESHIPGMKCLLTRDGDYFIPLSERAALANYKKVDLFISIHSNAAFSREANGFEVYHLSTEACDDEARIAAVAENEAVNLEDAQNKGDKGKQLNNIEMILGQLAQEEFIGQSQELSGFILESACRKLGAVDRGIKGAFFMVLKDALMPAVLVECGFISNPIEETNLRSTSFKDEISLAIAEGVTSYINYYETQMGLNNIKKGENKE